MPLQKQKISVLIAKGVQTKIDHKALPIDELAELENGEFTKIGRIDKRTGFSKVSQSSAALVAYKGDLISRNVRTTSDDNSSQAAAYSKSNSAMRGSKGWSSGLKYNSYPVSKGSSYNQRDPQVAVSNDGNYALVTFVSTDYRGTGSAGDGLAGHQGTFSGEVIKRCSVIDRQTNTVISYDLRIGDGNRVGGRRMRPLWVNDKFYIFGEDYDSGLNGSDLRVWTVDPTEAVIKVKDADGAESSAGTLIIDGSVYPLQSENIGGGSSAFPWNTVGASFDVCHSDAANSVNLMVTILSGGNTHVNYYQWNHSTKALSLKISDQITPHGVGVGALPVYYTIFKSLYHGSGGDKYVFLAYQDDTKFYVKRVVDGGTSGVITVVDDELGPLVTNFNVNCSFVDNHVSVGGTGGVDLYSSYKATTVVNANWEKFGIQLYSRLDHWVAAVNPLKMGHSTLAFAMPHKGSVTSQKGPMTVGGYGADPMAADFDAPAATNPVSSGETISEDFLDTIKLWTSDLSLSVYFGGAGYSGKQYLHERDYLKYGSLKTEYLEDALKVASPEFEALAPGVTALDGRMIAAPIATNYNTFGEDLVINSLIYIYDFKDEDYTTKAKASTALIQDTLYVADNGLFSYDGAEFNLHGITARPWLAYSQESVPYYSGVTDLGGGQYLYKGVFEWEDALGNLHQSEPSSHLLVDPVSSSSLALTYHPANELISEYTTDTEYDSPPEIYRDIRFALYRTEELGSTYNLNRVTRNFSRACFMKGIVDGKIDAENALGRFLYTDAGELSNTPPPSPAIYVTAHKNRLFIIGKDRRVYFSKLAIPGYGLSFNPALEVKLPDPASDSPVALGSMDGNLYIFTERSIYYVGGEGPDNVGTGGFYQAKKIPSASGAGYCTPVKLIDEGLVFSNGSRIFILNRKGSTVEIGVNAQDMIGSNSILDIKVDETKQIVYFQTSNTSQAELLTYNYSLKQWGRNVLQGETSIESVERYGEGLAISAGNNLYFSADNSKDDTSYVPLKLRTAWIKLDTYKGVHKFASLQGYQRVYNFQILGEAVDTHTLHVNVYYDYDPDTIVDRYTYTTTEAHSLIEPKKLQLKGHLSKQKCNAIQFEIYDSATDVVPTDGEGFTITHIELEIGQKTDQYKNGLMKIPGSQSFGVL